MKAIVQEAYGPPTVLTLQDLDRPVPGDDEVLVRVRAAAINAGDCFMMRGKPFLVRVKLGLGRPRYKVLGWDLAGRVEEVGKNETRFRPGDEVFGACETVCDGSFRASVLSARGRQVGKMFSGAPTTEDLVFLTGLLESGKITPVIDRTYPLSETPAAMGYAAQGHVRGKVVIAMDQHDD